MGNNIIWADNVELQAVEIEVYGKKQWRWVATNIEGDTFQKGKPVSIYTYADSFNQLFL